MLFQTLASSRDGKKVPFDVHESRRRALRRAFEFPKSDAHLLQFTWANTDEDGDEMYHDILDILLFVQLIDIPLPYAPVPRDDFRPMAKELHGNDIHLHHLSIPQEEFRTLVKLLVYAHSGTNSKDGPEQREDLDQVSNCIVKAFSQNPEVGITWEMFDKNLTKATPSLVDALYRILYSFITRSDSDDDIVLPNTGNILTFPIMGQLGAILSQTVCFDRLQLLQHYKCKGTQIEASALEKGISTAPDCVILLVSGRIAKTGEKAIFASFIPFPSQDGVQIQPREHDYWNSCLLFELSPVHDVYRGNVGQPGWTVVKEELCFGQRENGVVLVLRDDLRHATFVQNVDGENPPVYNANTWRGNWHMGVGLEEIELWVEL